MKKEIKIIGAGISGLTAGINLAKAGYKVKIFEKNNVVGKRFHNDYQGIENWVYDEDSLDCLKRINLDFNFDYYPVDNLNIIDPQGKNNGVQFKKNVFYLVRRGTAERTLDQGLYKQAIKSGAEIIFNSPKDHRRFGDIVAQGYFPDQFIDPIAVGYTFKTNISDQSWAIVDDRVAPDGYAYLLVANGSATLAVCMFRDYPKSREYLKRAYKIFQKHVNFDIKEKSFFSGTSNVFIMEKATFNQRLYVGEAAGFMDGMWGFGMKYALISGYLAAQSIIENKNYEKLWRKNIFSQLKASLVNRWYYKMLNKKSYEFIIEKMRQSQDPVLYLNKIGSYSNLHKLGLPFAYLALRKNIKDRRKLNCYA